MQNTTAYQAKFIANITSPLKLKAYLLYKLPMGFLAGLKVIKLESETCQVTVPYRWLNQNPFQSTYFAVLSMAAEFSTGVLALLHSQNPDYKVGTLVINLEAEFVKKATGITTFTCSDGNLFAEAIAKSIQTGEAIPIKATTVGTNAQGEIESKFAITWSVKAKKK